MIKVKNDLTGRTFGHWKVLSRADDYISPKGHKQARWLCQCECGTLRSIASTPLLNGKTTSCGCRSNDNKIGEIHFNKYDLSQEYGIGYDKNDNIFLFDLEDYSKIKNYCWHINTQGYVVSGSHNKCTLLHRLIMQPTDGYDIDHINRKPWDNRKSNLRIATRTENNANRPPSKNNKSGHTGVYWSKDRKMWCAQITINNKTILLGRYKNKEDAIKKREQAEDIYFKEFKYTP